VNIALVFPRFKYPSGDVPLGLGFIGAYLRAHAGVSVRIVDPTFEPDPLRYIEDHFRNNRYDLVGLSAMTPQIRDAFVIARMVKRNHPDCLVVVGGPHATILPEHTLSCEAVDLACIGEGEETLLDLVRNPTAYRTIPGLAWRQDGSIVRSPARAPIENVDSLPPPAYDLYDTDRYLAAYSQMDVVSPRLRGFFIMASRSCPFSCSYCQPTLQQIFGRKMRVHSPEYLVRLLQDLKQRYRIDSFFFADDTLNINRDWTARFCQALREADLGLTWGCNFRVDLIDRESLAALRAVGLRKVNIGIESGSQRILDEVFQKKITLEQVRSAVDLLNESGMRIHGYFMLGAPGETPDEIGATIALSRRLKIDDAMFSITTPLPGTHLFDRSRHLIGKDFEDFDYYRHSVYRDPSVLDEARLNRLRRRAVLGFYLRPRPMGRILRQIIRPGGFGKLLLKARRL
jgi:anaerobic magnesium-protoporphyrin IX monomethyl ester cyclase